MRALILLLLTMSSPLAFAADYLVDQGQQHAGLWVYPSLSRPNDYYYVPSTARLVTDDNGKPKFSLTFYIGNSDSQEAGTTGDSTGSSITTADGGGLLHFLMEYHTPPEQIQQAQRSLRELYDNDEINILGALGFHKGKYTIVSALAEQSKNRFMSQASAPVLEGNQLAISANLDPETATVLLQSMRTAVSDLSISFDLAFTGLTDAYDARMTVDWEKTSNTIGGGVGGTVYFISASVEAEVQRLFQDGAISLEVNGDDEAMEAIVARAHEKALELLFSEADIDEQEPEQQNAIGDMIEGLFSQGGALSSGATTGFGLNASFKYKDVRTEGKAVFQFNKRASIERHAVITANIGPQIKALLDDPEYVSFVSTHDSAFDLRKIFVMVDGALAPDIGEFVNSVTVKIRKQHPGGRESIDDVIISNLNLKQQTTFGPLTYNNIEKEKSDEWMSYDYATEWKFEGGGVYQTPWRESSTSMVSLDAPYRRQLVHIEGDGQRLLDEGIRAVVVEVEYDFFDQKKPIRQSFRPSAQAINIEPLEIILPEQQKNYRYQINWLRAGAAPLTQSGDDDLGYLFVDELPAQQTQ